MTLKKKARVLIFVFCIALYIYPSAQVRHEYKPVIIGYVGGYRGLAETGTIDARRLSHINYAFVDIKDNRAWLHNEKTDTINFRNLLLLKAQNPDLKILISVGGWIWSKHFSDAVLTDTSTQNFAQSAVDIVARYGLDGIDIDWEYPGMVGDSNTYRPEDKEHYTNLFKDLRQILDSLGKVTGKTYFVTTAVGGSADFIEHTQMNLVQLYTDYINVMSYDYDETYDSISSHHTNLFTSAGYDQLYSADKSIQNLLKAGVPARKIVMGIAFYGKGRLMASTDNNGLYRKPVKTLFGGGFTYIHDSLVNKKGFVRYWDRKAKAPYLFNAGEKVFITYDDQESVKYKCKYVKRHRLAGAMFWEYSSDEKEYLLKVMAEEFGYKEAGD
ncbi:MAG: glycoside hydrolase family 18 protein [Chitinophagales bacterium]